MKPENFNIFELIPQRPPMVMVDNIIFCDEKKMVTKFFILNENIFCINGVFTEPGLIENIAQTVATRMGYLNKINAKEVFPGYLASIKDLNIYFLPAINTEIQTEISIKNEVLGFTVIRGKVISEGRIAAECEMRVFIHQS